VRRPLRCHLPTRAEDTRPASPRARAAPLLGLRPVLNPFCPVQFDSHVWDCCICQTVSQLHPLSTDLTAGSVMVVAA